MKTLLFGTLGIILLCSCTRIAHSETNAPQHTVSIQVPSSLAGYKLTLSPQNVTHLATGSTGMEIAINAKFLNCKTKDWSLPERKVSLAYEDIMFTPDKWKSGKGGGTYTMERVGKDKLFIIMYDEDYFHDYIYILLDFKAGDIGTAIWGQEHSLDGNIQFKLQNTIQKIQVSSITLPPSLEGSIVNIDAKLSLYIQNGIAYVGSYSSDMKSKPKIRQVGEDRYGNPSYTDGWIRCNRYSYRAQGNKAQLFFSYTARHEYQVCQSASEVNEGTYIDYSYKDVPATITMTNKNGNTYEGTISGVFGSPEMSNPPEKLSKIQIIK